MWDLGLWSVMRCNERQDEEEGEEVLDAMDAMAGIGRHRGFLPCGRGAHHGGACCATRTQDLTLDTYLTHISVRYLCSCQPAILLATTPVSFMANLLSGGQLQGHGQWRQPPLIGTAMRSFAIET